MALYILLEKNSYFVENRAKHEIAIIKSLNQKRIPTVVFEKIEDVPEIFTDPKAVLLIANGISSSNINYIELCNKHNIPVIVLHDKTKAHYHYVYNLISDNEDATAATVYRYFKANNRDKIAFFGLYANSKSDISKVRSFYNVNPDFEYEDIFPIKSGFEECIADFVKRKDEYDGVYFPNDFLAIAFLEYFKKNDPLYLEKCFVLGTMDIIMSRLCPVTLSSVAYTDESVKAAVSQMYRSVSSDKNVFMCMSIYLNNIIIPRESTKKSVVSSTDFIPIIPRQNGSLKFEKVDKYKHQDDPALRDIFDLENLFLGRKPIDLLIIYMFLKGYSNSVITDKLFLTPQALNSHKNNYFKKVGCSQKSEFIEKVSKYVSLKNLEEYIQYISEDFTDFSNY